MEIMSLNVNGLNASIKHGLIKQITAMNPDIICLQETKISTGSMQHINFPNYPYLYSSSSQSEKTGSGVLIAAKHKPKRIIKDIGYQDIDNEARFLVAEYENFAIVNVYFPQVFRNVERYNFRLLFNFLFAAFILKILKKNSVIICGDFNVAHTRYDVYPGNWKMEAEDKGGFQDNLISDFTELLTYGLVDAFRSLHPKKRVYTWYSKKFPKSENKGKRLDYILVSKDIHKHIKAAYYQNLSVSDHAAAFVSITLEPTDNGYKWDHIDWQVAEQNLQNLQALLVKAAYAEDEFMISSLQQKITDDIQNKCLAVRHLANTAQTAGVDEVIIKTSNDKYNLAKSLTHNNYRSKPLRFVVVKNKITGKERRIGIPTAYDRAMQILYSYALDPLAEATGERKSFAFRRGRSILDINHYVFEAFHYDEPPLFVLRCDVKSCYYNISHKWLLDNIFMRKSVLREFLDAGYMANDKLFDTHIGIMPGTSISPILGNMVLDGLQKFIFSQLYANPEKTDYRNGNLIRYADDILITATSYSNAVQIQRIIAKFLQARGLMLNPEKTRISKAEEGFSYLMHEYKLTDGYLECKPSKASMDKLKISLENLILRHNKSLQSLIRSINSKLLGWATFHRHTDAQAAFVHIDCYIHALLLVKCRRMHPKLSQRQVINKYWEVDSKGMGHFRADLKLVQLADTIPIKRQKLLTAKNPYIDFDYFRTRLETRDVVNISGRYKTVWQRQGGRCHVCRQRMLPDDLKKLVPINPTQKETLKNKAYIHARCESAEYEIYQTTQEFDYFVPARFLDLIAAFAKEEPEIEDLSPLDLMEKLLIPRKFLKKDIPPNARLEIQRFWRYLSKKYSL